MQEYHLENLQGGAIHAKSGDTFTLYAKSNPSTGYSWQVVNSHDLGSNLAIVGDEYMDGNHPPGFVGGGGTQKYTIRANTSGEYKLELSYLQPWEPAGAQKHSVTIRVD